MRLLIVGDVHGQHERLAVLLARARQRLGIEAAIQVGDYGFTGAALGAAHPVYSVPVYAIDGNHDDHRFLHRAVEAGEDAGWRETQNLRYQGRPSVACVGTTTVGFIGGALHVDRPQRLHRGVRLANYVLRRQADEARTLFNDAQPQLIVSHSCPSRIGIGLEAPEALRHGVIEHIVSAGFDPGPSEDCGEAELSRLWASLAYRPSAWVFGHHHRPHVAEVQGTRFVCVGDIETSERCPVLWDTDSGALEWL